MSMNGRFRRISPLAVFMVLSGLVIWSCQNPPRPVRTTSHIRVVDQDLVEYNKGIVKTEEQEIDDFLQRYKWNMNTTPTGLRYLIYQQGSGLPATSGSSVRFAYACMLINGQQIYSSDSAGLQEITPGRREVETGLEEGLLLLREGDRAKLILPSHLAFGLLGDQRKIPPGATLVYDVEVIKVTPSP